MLYPLCDYLYPADIDKQNNCKNVIDNSLPQIIETVVNNYGDVEKICTTLTLCPQIKVYKYNTEDSKLLLLVVCFAELV